MRYLLPILALAMLLTTGAQYATSAQEAKAKEAAGVAKPGGDKAKPRLLASAEIKIIGLVERREATDLDIWHPMSSHWGYFSKGYSRVLLSLSLGEIPFKDVSTYALAANFKITSDLDPHNLLYAESKAAKDSNFIERGRIQEVSKEGHVWSHPSFYYNDQEKPKDLRFIVQIETPHRDAKSLEISGDVLISTKGSTKKAYFTATKSDKPGKTLFEDKAAGMRVELAEIGKRQSEYTVHGSKQQIISLDASDGEGREMRYSFNSLDRESRTENETRFTFHYSGGLPLEAAFEYRKTLSIYRIPISSAKNTILADDRDVIGASKTPIKPVANGVAPVVKAYREVRNDKEGALNKSDFGDSRRRKSQSWAMMGFEYKIPKGKGLMLRYAFDEAFCISANGELDLRRTPETDEAFQDPKANDLYWQHFGIKGRRRQSEDKRAGMVYMRSQLYLPHKAHKSLQINGIVHVDMLQDVKAKSVQKLQANRNGTVIWQSAEKDVSIEVESMTLAGEIKLVVKGQHLKISALEAKNETGKSRPLALTGRDAAKASYTLSEKSRSSLLGARKRAVLSLRFQAAAKIERKKIPLYLKSFKLP